MYNNLSIDDVFDLMSNNLDIEKIEGVMENAEFYKCDYNNRRVMAFTAMMQLMIMIRRSPLTVKMSIGDEMMDIILMLLYDYVRGVIC